MYVPDELTASFPVATVVFPGDELNLHIIEPRYLELINDCAKTKMPFGIPAVVGRQIGELGTLVSGSGWGICDVIWSGCCRSWPKWSP